MERTVRIERRKQRGGAWTPPLLSLGALLVLSLAFGVAIAVAIGKPQLAAVPPALVMWYAACLRWPTGATTALLVFDATAAPLLKIYFPGSTAVPAASDVLAVCLILALASRFGIPKVYSLLDVLVSIFIALVFVTAVMNPLAPRGLQLVGGVRTLALYPVFYFYGSNIFRFTPARRLYSLCALLAVLLGSISIVQAVAGPAWAVSHHLLARVVRDWTTAGGNLRPSSLLPLPGVAGVLFGALGIVLFTTFAYRSVRPPIPRKLAALGFLMALAGLVLSGQRAAVVGFVVGVITIVLVARSRPLAGIVLLSAGVIIFAASLAPSVLSSQRVTDVTAVRSTSSVDNRYATWREVIRQLPSYPLGHGPGYTGSAATRYGGGTSSFANATTDNYWVKMLWELGVPGALWYTAFLGAAVASVYREVRAGANAAVETYLPLAALGLVAQQACAAAFNNVLDPLPYSLLFWLILGLVRPTGNEPTT
jgi:hypothetical protein